MVSGGERELKGGELMENRLEVPVDKKVGSRRSDDALAIC